jgi:hypothetical protein
MTDNKPTSRNMHFHLKHLGFREKLVRFFGRILIILIY